VLRGGARGAGYLGSLEKRADKNMGSGGGGENAWKGGVAAKMALLAAASGRRENDGAS
jgi:hypothetical protein